MTTALPMPDRIAALPRARGYPVPFFVAWVDGVADFRIVDGAKLRRCMTERRCWLCGQRLGAYLAFVIGPMCAVNRVSSEPPSHRECAEYAVQVCPFLTQPDMGRRSTQLPAVHEQPAGIMLPRNPGVALVWVTKHYTLRPVASDEPGAKPGVLFIIGEPIALSWWAEGRTATRAEVLASIDSGLPTLRDLAHAQGIDAAKQFDQAVSEALTLVPV